MKDMRRAHAGAKLARLRRMARELKLYGWTVQEPEDALQMLVSLGNFMPKSVDE